MDIKIAYQDGSVRHLNRTVLSVNAYGAVLGDDPNKSGLEKTHRLLIPWHRIEEVYYSKDDDDELFDDYGV